MRDAEIIKCLEDENVKEEKISLILPFILNTVERNAGCPFCGSEKRQYKAGTSETGHALYRCSSCLHIYQEIKEDNQSWALWRSVLEDMLARKTIIYSSNRLKLSADTVIRMRSYLRSRLGLR